MIRSLMKLMLAAFAAGASGGGQLRKEERALYRKALCERQRSMEALNTAQQEKQKLLSAVAVRKAS
jgi:uncharacterized membrane protein